jgi:hypothetical protein
MCILLNESSVCPNLFISLWTVIIPIITSRTMTVPILTILTLHRLYLHSTSQLIKLWLWYYTEAMQRSSKGSGGDSTSRFLPSAYNYIPHHLSLAHVVQSRTLVSSCHHIDVTVSMSVNRTKRILEEKTQKYNWREEARNITANMMEIGPRVLHLFPGHSNTMQ